MLLWMACAHAAEIDVYVATEFGQGPIAGGQGWLNGYGPDVWDGADGLAYSDTDENNTDSSGNSYGSGWAADNWLVNGDAVAQGGVEVKFENDDDDTAGAV